MSLAALVVLSTMHFEGDALPGGGDYVDVPFTVPAGTVEIQVSKSYPTGFNILDFGVWSPDGYRGWSGGLVDDVVVGVDQSSRGYLPGAVTPGTWTVVIGKAQLATTGAHWTIDVTCRDAATLAVLAKAPFAPVVLATDKRWYKGDFHVHSSQSGDSRAALQDDVDLAAARGLDFFNLSDHNTIAQHALVAAQQASWPVLVLRSSEITTYSGHGNGVGIHDYVDHRLGYNGRTMANVIDDVVAQGGAFIVNHPATNLGTNCTGCGWMHDDDVPWDEVSGMEVLTAGWDLGVQVFTPTILKLWDSLEDQGHRIAAVTGSDDHNAGQNEGSTGAPLGSPCTRVLADGLSEAAILDGLRGHHTIAQLRGPDDPPVDVAIKTKDGGTATIGDEVDGLARVELTVHVTSGTGMFAQVWRDGLKSQQIAVDRDDFTWNYEDIPGAADHRYRVELMTDTNQRVVITSHIYVHGIAGGGGCSVGGGAGWLAALGLVGLGSRRRRR